MQELKVAHYENVHTHRKSIKINISICRLASSAVLLALLTTLSNKGILNEIGDDYVRNSR